MSEFITPKFERTIVCEALLKTSDVHEYMEKTGVSFEQAVETLGLEYVSKYAQYCTVSGTPFSKVQD